MHFTLAEMGMSEAARAIAESETDAKEQGVSFMELREGRCKFPPGSLGDPTERFCGELATIGSPYCPDCRRIVYVPNARRPQ